MYKFNYKEQKLFDNKQYRELCRHFFNHPNPPVELWEGEFDYADDKLWELSQKDWQSITRMDLHCYYVLNLRYHDLLQASLFRYLFPIALAIWAERLEDNDHFEGFLGALYAGNVLPRMLDEQQFQKVTVFVNNIVISKFNHYTESSNLLRVASDLDDRFYALSLLVDIQEAFDELWKFNTPLKVFYGINFLKKIMGVYEYEAEGSILLNMDDVYDHFILLPKNLQTFKKNLLYDQFIPKLESTKDIAEKIMDIKEFNELFELAHVNKDYINKRLNVFFEALRDGNVDVKFDC